MKLKKLILIIGILTYLFGCKNNKDVDSDNIYPKEEFSVLDAKLEDGRPAVGSFNLAYKNYEFKSKYPWCLKISIGLNIENCMENGLSDNPDEIRIVNQLENELLENIKGISTSHYIGHLFNDTFLDIYVYLDNPEKVHKWLQTQVNKEGLIRGFGYEIKEDTKWDTIKSFMN